MNKIHPCEPNLNELYEIRRKLLKSRELSSDWAAKIEAIDSQIEKHKQAEQCNQGEQP